MPPVRIEGKKIYVGGEGRFFLSGEVHPWRLHPQNWRAVLRRIKEMGLQMVSTYVCWHYHEIEPGRFDFHGKTEAARNIAAFLEMVAEEDLWLILRPGPYIYAEWVNMGVPDRVAPLHRLHPEFLREAQAYMAAVVEFARPYFATNGGPIVLFQADNEPDPWSRFYETPLGLGRVAGLFQEFLREWYRGDIQALNEAWEVQLNDFTEARAVTSPARLERRYLNRYLDFRRFLYWYTTRIAEWSAGEYRRLGVDLPLLLNHYPSHGVQNWRLLDAAGDISGPDYYSHNEFRRDAWEHQEFLHLLRYTRTYTQLPCSPELQCGSWHGWHYISGVLSPRHYEFSALSALLAGMAGWNWYMLVNRDNWYMSPINEWGRTRPELFEVFQRIVALFHRIEPTTLEKLTETAIAFDVLDRSSEIGGFSDPVLTALYQAGIDYECFDLATGHIKKPLIFYAGHQWMARASQQRLLEFVESGGHLVFFDQLPTQDDYLRPLNLLGLHEPESVLVGGKLALFLGDEKINSAPSYFSSYREVTSGIPLWIERRIEGGFEAEEGKIHFHLPVGTRYLVGYHEKRRQGTLTVLGMPPSAEVVLAVHRWLNISIYSRSAAHAINTALFRRGDDFYLIAANNNDTPQDVMVALHADLFQNILYTVHDLISNTSAQVNIRQQRQVTFHVPAKNGTALHFFPEKQVDI